MAFPLPLWSSFFSPNSRSLISCCEAFFSKDSGAGAAGPEDNSAELLLLFFLRLNQRFTRSRRGAKGDGAVVLEKSCAVSPEDDVTEILLYLFLLLTFDALCLFSCCAARGDGVALKGPFAVSVGDDVAKLLLSLLCFLRLDVLSFFSCCVTNGDKTAASLELRVARDGADRLFSFLMLDMRLLVSRPGRPKKIGDRAAHSMVLGSVR